MIEFTPGRYLRNKPKGKVIEILDTETGKKKRVRLKKWIPAKCSRPRRICLSCQTVSIHKNSKFYDLKVCEACHASN